MAVSAPPRRRAAPAFRLGVRPASVVLTRLWTLRRAGILRRHHLQLRAHVPYRPSGPYPATGGACHLDLYRPAAATAPLPTVLYVHGGGFSMLAKETYWALAARWARRGYLVAAIDYRLAPAHPFPAALTDACAALHWLAGHAAALGGDAGRLLLAGDSAGANLVTALALALASPRPERYARPLFDLGLRPRAVLPACGLLQLSDPGRFARADPTLPGWTDARIRQVSALYLGAAAPGTTALASPLLWLEGDAAPARPLPPFFIAVGARDPLRADSLRLHAALRRRGVAATLAVYPRAGHAFHALPWRRAVARRCWADTFAYLARL